jgi:hypothetical protein
MTQHSEYQHETWITQPAMLYLYDIVLKGTRVNMARRFEKKRTSSGKRPARKSPFPSFLDALERMQDAINDT